MMKIEDSAARSRRIQVVHLITGLEVGGAEIVLSRLLRVLDTARVQSTVVSLTSGGTLAADIRSCGVPVIELNMRSGNMNAAGLYRAYKVLRSLSPDVLQTWLYHADFVGLILGRLAGVKRIVWNIRCATLDFKDFGPRFGLMVRLLARSSRWPDAIIVNSVTGRHAHERLGYRPRRWEIIANGVDPVTFRRSPEGAARFRRELAAPEAAALVGMVARLHPMKDHATFIRAAAQVPARHGAHFVLVGRGVPESQELRSLVAALNLDGRMHLLPERANVADVFSALDIAVLSSASEGFPNVLVEARACGTPCVTTDAGDSAQIVGDPARVVAVRDPAALAAAIVRLLDMHGSQRMAVGLQDRSRVMGSYSLTAMAARYQRLYEELVPPGTDAPQRSFAA